MKTHTRINLTLLAVYTAAFVTLYLDTFYWIR
jgi:hypothetical protein